MSEISGWRIIGAVLLVLGACSAPVVEDRMCVGLVDSPAGVVVSSQGTLAPGAAPTEMMRAAVADRTAEMLMSRMGSTPAAAVPVAEAGGVTPSFARRTVRRALPPVVDIDILAMTTGGQYGSFSSGFLTGWGARGDRPDFAVVTGASAGGVVAPLVFAGPQFDGRLKLNTGLKQRDVVRQRGVLELLSASSLYSTAPLRRSIEAAVDEPLIRAIAARWAAGNDLLLGATNLDRGRFDLLDIGAFMADGAVPLATKRACLVSAVMATSAIPALFPPERINGDLYTDAGVRQSVFLRGVRDGIRKAQGLLGVRIRVTAYVIVNSDLEVPQVTAGTGLLSVAERTFQLVTDEGLRQSLIETADLARGAGWRLRAVRAPGHETLGCVADGALFSPCVTRALFAAGARLGGAPKIAWMDGDDLKRIAGRY